MARSPTSPFPRPLKSLAGLVGQARSMAVNPTGQFVGYAGADPEKAKFFWTGGPVEVAERTWFASFVSGVTAFETDEGLVLVDTGSTAMAPALARLLRQRSRAPVHTVVYTHGHLDHAYGLPAFLGEGQRPPRVIAQRAITARFDRYGRTQAMNEAINTRQFRGGLPEEGLPGGLRFGPPPMPPDTLYDSEFVFEVGGVRFELYHARGETDDASWVWCPERQVLCPGDLWIWAVPNCGNPQKVQRYPAEWAKALRAMATLRPNALCPGHGGPVVDDPERIQLMLSETAAFLEDLVEQTVAALNQGAPPHVDVVHQVRIPESDSPWLQPLYDEGEFIVRNIVRESAGWWTGRPSELKPAARSAIAEEIASLAGGPRRLAERANELAAVGDFRLASHLADYALEAAPDDKGVRDKVAAFYKRRASSEPSLMATNIFLAAAAYARAGRPFR